MGLVKRLTIFAFCMCIILNILVMRILVYIWKRTFYDLPKKPRSDIQAISVVNIYPDILFSDMLFGNQRLGTVSQQTVGRSSRQMFNFRYHLDFVIFTSFEPSTKRYTVHNNTKRNWPSLGSKMRAVLFTNYSTLGKEFTQAGWDILPLLHVSRSGTPILKYMFMEFSKRYHTSYMGYSNSDVLFTDKFTKTLETIRTHSLVNHTHVMLTGRRINVNNITREEAVSFQNLSKASQLRGVIYRADAEDYFFTNRFYPWSAIKDLVIGRVAYDNFLLLHARMSNFTVLDLSQTVDAVHQTVDKGHLEEQWKTQDQEKNYNNILIQNTYRAVNYYAGQTNCLEYETQNKSNQIVIYRRKTFAKYCAFKTTEGPISKTKVKN